MSDTKKKIDDTLAKLAETLNRAPEEKLPEISRFMEGYLAALESVLGRQEAS